jgi:hypothetical protein
MRARALLIYSSYASYASALAGIVLVTACGGSGSGPTGSGGMGGGAPDGTGGSVPVGSGGSAPAGSGGSAQAGGVKGNGGSASGTGGAGSGGVKGSGGAPGTGGSASGGSTGSCTPDYTCKPSSPDTGDAYADCVARVNQFRACVCLPPLARWSAGEACADQDAKYDSEQNTAHAGFSAGICTAGNAQDECPGWSGSYAKVISGCLQMMFDEGPPPTSTCTGTCYQDHGHYINMTGTKYKNGVACGFYTMPNGQIWAAQNFQ